MGTLTPEVAGLGLMVAFTSLGSVTTSILLLTMSDGVRRAIAFICGWILGIAVLAVLTVVVLRGNDFGSRHTTPSRVVSVVEVVLGCLLVVGSALAYRRPTRKPKSQSPPQWLDRFDRMHWLIGVVVGALMVSYTLTLATGAEILKANVGTVDAVLAYIVFALTSIVTITAPVVVAIVAPERSAHVLAAWKEWLLANSRSIALILLAGVGVFLIVRGAHDLAA